VQLERRVEPEWLDELPADDPRAIRSRRDLRMVNRIMGHAAIIGKALSAAGVSDTPRIAELGAGDGTLLLRVAGSMQWLDGAEVALVDRQPAVSAETGERYRERGCEVRVDAADVFEWLENDERGYHAIVANLFLHHFETEALARMFALAAARAPVFVACEPRRARLPLAGSRMLGFIGCSDVTRHDAVVSVRAGFAGEELSQLWPRDGWSLEERKAGLFSHLFTTHCSPLTAHE
jgi:hypothetical protein